MPGDAREPLWKPRDVADFLEVSERTIEGWRQRGAGPPFIKVSARRIRYRPEDVEGWIESRLRASTSADGPPPESS